MSTIRRITKPGMTVLDIGANIGAHTLLFSSLVGAAGRVVAFEPTDFAYAKLQKNVALNPRSGRRARAHGVGRADDPQQQVDFRASWQTNGGRVNGLSTVDMIRLDDWAETHRAHPGRRDQARRRRIRVSGDRRRSVDNCAVAPDIHHRSHGSAFSDAARNPFEVLRSPRLQPVGYRVDSERLTFDTLYATGCRGTIRRFRSISSRNPLMRDDGPQGDGDDDCGGRRDGRRFVTVRVRPQLAELPERFDRDRISEAESSLKQSIGVERLPGASFIDVGSGSGLFSLAAHRLGARRVHSFDYDRDSVACTVALRDRYGRSDVTGRSARQCPRSRLPRRLGQFDMVYSWGVLHHTGAMWQALENVIRLVKPGGLLFVAIYNDQGS